MKRGFFLFFLLIFSSSALFADEVYPEITELYAADPQYAQLCFDIEAYYSAQASSGELPGFVFRRYTPTEGMTLIALSSLLSLPFETIASLNRLSSNIVFDGKTEILIPNRPALFLPERRKSDLELMVFEGHDWNEEQFVRVRSGELKELFFWLDGQSYGDLERSYFLGFLRFFPVPKGRITSDYGIRKDPFHGRESFHGGVDIAAPAGTDVICPQNGTVAFCGEGHPIYGTYIEIIHDNDVRTRYAHLSNIYVSENQFVAGGDIIAAVGSTGRATGPHLHFEFISDDTRKDPRLFLNF